MLLESSETVRRDMELVQMQVCTHFREKCWQFATAECRCVFAETPGGALLWDAGWLTVPNVHTTYSKPGTDKWAILGV